MLVLTTCNSETIKMFDSDAWTMQRNDLGYVLVIIDIIVILSFTVFVKILRIRIKQYIADYKTQTIEMSDFTLRIVGLPTDTKYGDNEHILRAKIWQHMIKVVQMGHAEAKEN